MKTITCILLLSSTCLAVDIPADCRVKNQLPGYCTWANLETLGKVNKIESLNNLLENRKNDPDLFVFTANGIEFHRKNSGYNYAVENKLNKLKVKYLIQNDGNFNKDLFKKYTKTHGCIFTVKAGAMPNYNEPHSLIMMDYADDKILFYDCNYVNKEWNATNIWLDYYWTGSIIVLTP